MTKSMVLGASPKRIVALLDSHGGAAKASLEMLSSAYFDYKNTVEVETTRRSAIAAWRDTRLAEIDSQKTVLEEYLKLQFRERAHLIDEFFVRLDQGIENNNSHLIDSAIGAILAISKESPIAQAKELITAMRNPDVSSIEI